ncbi:HK97-gp10 family putative phage morphogenesis protein [Lactobacillus terrae]|uniref:HK97-gp10 family putative phage morphogenesis protein n=1 Tax=Lactobacillus terrae TaxID=2269374 RepID=UPI000C1B7CB9|nr:HK97-gp10 family putative phage morphogenesis protein [Lactobacillus terrae]
MTVTGIEEMLNNVTNIEKGFDRKARKAVQEGGKYFGDELQKNTPVSSEDRTGKGPLKDHVKVSNVSLKTGEYEVKVGYDKIKGRIAHFPNSGTTKQDPQHFIEETQAESKEKILEIFKDNLTL